MQFQGALSFSVVLRVAPQWFLLFCSFPVWSTVVRVWSIALSVLRLRSVPPSLRVCWSVFYLIPRYFVQRVTWLCVNFWPHYEMRENNHAHSEARSFHCYKLTVKTKHFWGKRHLQGKKPTLWIKLDIKIKFWHTCRLFQLNPRARSAVSYMCLSCLPST